MAESQAARRERNPIAALARILGAMAERPEPTIGVRELARALDTPPSSVQRTLESAREASLVSGSGAGQWELGWELFRIAALVQRKLPHGAARGVLDELREQSGETAVLTVYDVQSAARMFVAGSSSRHSVRFVPELLHWLPMHAGATALAILAHRPESERTAIYRRGLPALTGTTRTSATELERALVRVRERGYAVSRDEVALGASALAAPIATVGGVTSSVAVIAPQQRFDAIIEAGLAEQVLAAAARLGERLGNPTAVDALHPDA